MQKPIVVIALLSMLSACTWVQLSPGGEEVTVLTLAQANNRSCELLGRASSTTMDRIVVVDRSDERQQRELITLARNEAANMGGNAIAPQANISNGRQQFNVYNCP
jgi:hypothetical protein